MLTADLVRARVSRGKVVPDFVDPDDDDDLALAADLIGVFQAAAGRERRHLDDDLKALLGTGTRFLLHRGLTKLLLDRCTFGTEGDAAPADVRAELLDRAAAARRADAFDRAEILAAAGAALGAEPDALERAMFADLKSEQLLLEFDEITPAGLLERYNVALAQALLLRAGAMELRLPKLAPGAQRRLFRWIKFHRLLFTLEKLRGGGLRIQLDGPLTVLRASQRYGVQLALFLPRVLELPAYRVEAQVQFGRGRAERTLVLDEESGLAPPRKAPDDWIPDELRWLPDQLAKLTDAWDATLDTSPVDLGAQGVLVPDYTFTHRESGRQLHMEVLGFWRRGAVDSRLRLLRDHPRRDWILALSRDLRIDEGDLPDDADDLYLFRISPVAREVLKRLETRLAELPAPGRKPGGRRRRSDAGP